MCSNLFCGPLYLTVYSSHCDQTFAQIIDHDNLNWFDIDHLDPNVRLSLIRFQSPNWVLRINLIDSLHFRMSNCNNISVENWKLWVNFFLKSTNLMSNQKFSILNFKMANIIEGVVDKFHGDYLLHKTSFKRL